MADKWFADMCSSVLHDLRNDMVFEDSDSNDDEDKLHLLRIEKNIQLLYDIASVTVFYSLIILKSAKFTLKGLFF
jgi:hypothetical protein